MQNISIIIIVALHLRKSYFVTYHLKCLFYQTFYICFAGNFIRGMGYIFKSRVCRHILYGCKIFSFMCMFCRSLFVLLSFFFWPLCCLFFFDIQILITPLVSSNTSFDHSLKTVSIYRLHVHKHM